MKLYHGTTERNLTGILAAGIQPGDVAEKNNWPEARGGQIPGVVYLTDKLGWFFAWAAARQSIESGDGHRPCVIQCSVGAERLLPDADYIAQTLSCVRQVPFGEMIGQVDLSAMRESRPAWRASLDRLGMVAHEGAVAPRQLRRIVVLEFELLEVLDRVAEAYWPRLGFHSLVAADALHIHRVLNGESHTCHAAARIDTALRAIVARIIFERPPGLLRILSLNHGRVCDERVA